jgi:hypothetical protein
MKTSTAVTPATTPVVAARATKSCAPNAPVGSRHVQGLQRIRPGLEEAFYSTLRIVHFSLLVSSSPFPASRRTTFPASSASRSLTARPRIVVSHGLRSRGATPLPCAVEADAAEADAAESRMRRRLGPSDFAGNAEHSRDGVVAKRQDGAPMLAARARNVDVAVNERIGGNTDSHPAHLGNLK